MVVQSKDAGDPARTAPGPASADTVRCDVVVVGGGFAGVVAARELRRPGRSVVLVEARDRLGGRTHSELRDGHVTEYGGTWVHWTQPHVWAEVQRYGLPIVETPQAASRFIVSRSGQPQDVPTRQAAEALAGGLSRLLSEASIVFPRPYEPFFAAEELAKRSDLSVADRMTQLQMVGLERDLVSAFYGTLGHCDPADVAYVEALRVWALAGCDYARFSDSLGRYRLKDGTGALIEAIRADGDPEIILSDPVTAVAQDASGVSVTTASGRRISARGCILAAPLNVLGAIDYTPPLSAEKLRHSEERHAGHGVKGYAVLRQDVGPAHGFAPYPARITSFMTEESGHGGTRLIFFGPDQSQLDTTDVKAVESALREFFPDADVVEVISHDWASDPYSQGTWCTFRPGQLARYFPANREQEGRLFFASGDTATGWRGYIDGAIERGLRTAHEVSRLLDQDDIRRSEA